MAYNPGNPNGPNYSSPSSNQPYDYGNGSHPVGPTTTANGTEDISNPSDALDALNYTEPYFRGSNEPNMPPTPPALSKIKLPSPTLSTFCFFLAILLFQGLGVLLIGAHVSSIMVTVIGEIGLIAALPIIFTGLGNFDFKAVFSVRKIAPLTLFLCVLLGLAAQLAIIFPNALGIWLLQQIGPLYLPPDSGTNLNTTDKLIFSGAALFLAPLCEETLNRGFVMAGYRRFGLVRTIIIIGILFGLFHMYPYKFIGTGLGGLILAYVCYTTGSIYSSMAAHFGFNLLPTIILWISDPLRQLLPNGTVASVPTTLAYTARGDIETRIDASAVTGTILLSGIGLGLTLLLMRSITKRTTKLRPGLVLNYFGLATRVDEQSQLFQSGNYYGPNAGYGYGEFGWMWRNLQPNYATGVGDRGWKINNYPNQNPVNKTDQTSHLSRGGRISLAAMWVILLVLYVFGAYQELFLREVGRDCELHGFQHCEKLLPKAALVQTPPSPAALQIVVTNHT